jgi:putative IMPACT (imprinted ancient) family translation regulator
MACSFEHVGTVYQLIAQFDAEKRRESFVDGGLHVVVALPRAKLPALQNALRDATRGQARIADAHE